MNALQAWTARQSQPLRQVFGPLWTFWAAFATTVGVVALFCVAVAAGGEGMHPWLPTARCILIGPLVPWVSGHGVARHARQQRLWQQRLAPDRALQRLDRGAVLGLLGCWVGTLPLVLLGGFTQQEALPPLALLAAFGGLMGVASLAAAALQGRLSLLGLLPALALLALLVGHGLEAVWQHWRGLANPLLTGMALVGPAAALWTVLARPTASTREAPLRWLVQTWRRHHAAWRQRHQLLRHQGEALHHGAALWLIIFPTWVVRERLDTAFDGVALVCGLGMLLAFFYKYLVAPNLHWRWQLAPGRAQRRHLGWRIAAGSWWHMLCVALPNLLLWWLLWSALTPASMAEVLPALPLDLSTALARITLAIGVATWLRAQQASTARLAVLGALFVAAQALAHALLVKGLGLDTPSLAAWVVTALGLLLLARPIQQAWMRCDLGRFQRPGPRE